MSSPTGSITGISGNSVFSRTPTSTQGEDSGAQMSASDNVRRAFGKEFRTTFDSSLASVAERGANGEFDNPDLTAKLAAAEARLAKAAALTAGGTGTGTGTGAVTGGGPAPDPTSPATSSPTAGTPPASDAPSGADVLADAPTTTDDASSTSADAHRSTDEPVAADASAAAHTGERIAAERDILSIRVQQSKNRLANISSSLERDFPKAAALTSASSGTWDPATFVPRTREEVEAFAQRMVIDATEAAARLEIVKNELDAARFDAQHGGGDDASAAHERVANLEIVFARQQAYVDKLATIVDRQSGGQMASVGAAARAGVTLRGAGDISTEELAQAYREAGMDEAQIDRIIGAGELGIEQERTPGGSTRLKQIADSVTESLLVEFNRMTRRHEQRMDTIREDARKDRQQLLETAAEKRVEAKREERKHRLEQEFQAWIQQVAAEQQARQEERARAS